MAEMNRAWDDVTNQMSALLLKLKLHTEEEFSEDELDRKVGFDKVRSAVGDAMAAIQDAYGDEAVRHDAKETGRAFVAALDATVGSVKAQLRGVTKAPLASEPDTSDAEADGPATVSRAVHFDIPIDDPERAGAFYREVFGWNVEKWGPIDYWTMTTGQPPGRGAEGALTLRDEAPEGVVVYISVDDIDAATARVEASGGESVQPKSAIPGVGWSSRVRDTEGNLFGLYQDDPESPMPEGFPG